MNFSKKIITALVIPFVGMAGCCNNSGLYIGASGGVENIRIQDSQAQQFNITQAIPGLDITAVHRQVSSPDLSALGGIGRFYLGYGKYIQRFYLGLEVFGGIKSSRASWDTVDDATFTFAGPTTLVGQYAKTEKIKIKDRNDLGVALMLGGAISRGLLGFVKVGYINSEFKMHIDGSGSFNNNLLPAARPFSFSSSGSSRLNGIDVGIGFLQNLTKRLLFRSEADYVFYKKRNIKISTGGGTGMVVIREGGEKITPQGVSVLLGLVYLLYAN